MIKPKIYLVGGAVRDLLLGLEPKDRDYVVEGATEEWMLAQGYQKVGADFPVFLHPTIGEEYALARQERKTGPGYHGFDTRFDPEVTLDDDLLRRDLTINAMAMNDEGVVIDPYGGLNDLKNKVLRHTSDAFKEDPLRVLRLARFAARYTDFTIAPETKELASLIVANDELEELPKERIWTELWKGFNEKAPLRMLEFLYEIGALKHAPLRPYFRTFSIEGARLLYGVTDVQPLTAALLGLSFWDEDAKLLCIPSDVKKAADWAQYLISLISNEKLSPEDILLMIKRTRFIANRHSIEMLSAIMATNIRSHVANKFERFAENLARLIEGATTLQKLDYASVVHGAEGDVRTAVEAAELEALKKLPW